MNKLKKIFSLLLIFILIFILFKYNYLLQPSVISSLKLWLTKVFPSLFIMFILNDLIISTNVLQDFNKLINPLFNKLFKTNGNAFACFILSLFSGSPTNAYIINETLKKGEITRKTANNLMRYTYFSNPLFLYNILSGTFNKYITFKIIIIHYLANIIIGLFLTKGEDKCNLLINNKEKKNSFILSLPKSITKSINTLSVIFGCITFYMIITNIIISIIPLNNTLKVIFKGLLEITQGLNILNTISNKSIIKEIIAIFLISFGGLSIHTQVLSLTTDNKELYQNYFIGRVFQALISTNAYILIYIITTYL